MMAWRVATALVLLAGLLGSAEAALGTCRFLANGQLDQGNAVDVNLDSPDGIWQATVGLPAIAAQLKYVSTEAPSIVRTPVSKPLLTAVLPYC